MKAEHPFGSSPEEATVKPPGSPEVHRVSPAQVDEPTRGATGNDLMDTVVDRQTMVAALKRVEQNKGAPGPDGMKVGELRAFLKENWPSIKSSLLSGTYQPQPVRRVEIPKPGGGTRLLGIPSVIDRLIQQAILQTLNPVFDPTFSESSYGFRPGRRGWSGVQAARLHVAAGYSWVVDMDLEKFFDKVNHDILMARVARRVRDKRILLLIRRYLEAGILSNGVAVVSEEGTPQGGPLSPLLANILLDDLDKELEARGHRFGRYADDCNIYVRSARAGERVKRSITAFLQSRLRLTVNEAKSAVDRPVRRQFLGFSLTSGDKPRIRLAPRSLQRAKNRIRELTSRTRSQNMGDRIKALNAYLRGWLGYFSLAETPSPFQRLDEWLRRRLRMCLWKQWKRISARRRNLVALGMEERKAIEWANTRKGCWRIAGSPVLSRTLTNAYWQSQGLISLSQRYQELRQA